MLCAAQTALIGLPASASRNIPIICSSLNRLLFMFCSFSQAELQLCHVPLLGVSPVGVNAPFLFYTFHLEIWPVVFMWFFWMRCAKSHETGATS